ncbi:Alpha/Beta hydrolase protein [Lineolata rhizophorae]|uniref:Alpha/Beta hydrolase protein n=1 Tax=Lineolata rhizophorae TaxID=578093 RepID=A0A6A6NXT0_9PEZI|nr:Alpha/Beta hydrolase protein [Lineolata rhizophorae]
MLAVDRTAQAPNGASSKYPNDGLRLARISAQPDNPFSSLIPDQTIAIIPSFTLESGVTLYNVPVAYKTYGVLSPERDNAMVICHALTGSSDVADWWGPLLGGPGKAFDISRFFVVCINSLGSPYGSASPVTSKDGDPAKGRYGPEFPLTTIRDDVIIFKLILDDLGVKRVATVIGGSMGGMLVLEFAYFGRDYVRTIIPIATSARYSAWGISWGEAQRQSIYSDPKYDDGYYSFEDPPSTGLGAARMSALLTYRSRDSFEARFGRNTPDPSRRQNINGHQQRVGGVGDARPTSPAHEHYAIHNDGHKHAGSPRVSRTNSGSAPKLTTATEKDDPEFHTLTQGASSATRNGTSSPFGGGGGGGGASSISRTTVAGGGSSLVGAEGPKKRTPTYFSAQSYLRYQGDKFIKRFDANCYIAITRKLDTHDVSRGRFPPPRRGGDDDDDATAAAAHPDEASSSPLQHALSLISQPTLILGIESDGLFTFAEQRELAACIPQAALRTIDSSEGHDAFLLEFEQVNRHLLEFLERELPDVMAREPVGVEGLEVESAGEAEDEGKVRKRKVKAEMQVKKTSTFGEAEVDDITAW